MKVPSFVKTIAYQAQKHSPEIFTAFGVGLIVAGTVDACKQSMELSPELEAYKDQINEIHEIADHAREHNNPDYNDELEKHDVAVIYRNIVVDTAKRYARPAAIILTGVASIVYGNHILKKRNIALATAYTAVSTAFSEYRERVIEDQGQEADFRYRTGAKILEKTVEEVDENGKKKKVKQKEIVVDPNAKGTGYLKYITPANKYWNDDPQMMEMLLNQEQDYANNMLHINKKWTIGKVWERLGLHEDELSTTGMVMGWIDGECKENFINFNVTKCTLVNEDGQTIPAYAIDPNVQCNVYATINKKRANAIAAKEAA